MLYARNRMRVENAMLRPSLQIDWTPNGRRGYRAASFAIDRLETESKARKQRILLCYGWPETEWKSRKCRNSSFATDWPETKWKSRMQCLLLCYKRPGNRMKVENAIILFWYRLPGDKIKVENAMPPHLLQIGSKQDQCGECTDSSSGTDWLEREWKSRTQSSTLATDWLETESKWKNAMVPPLLQIG